MTPCSTMGIDHPLLLFKSVPREGRPPARSLAASVTPLLLEGIKKRALSGASGHTGARGLDD